MYKHKLSALWLVISLLSILMTSCGTASRGGPTPTPLPPMVSYEKSVFTVEVGPIVSEKKIYGEIVPSKQDELYFLATGYVDRVIVKQGDTVKQGDLLAEMQVTDLLDQLEQANIDLEVAEATLEKGNAQREYNLQRAQIDVTISEKNVELAKLDLENAYTKDDRERAQLRLDILEQNLTLTKLNLTQAQEAVSTYEQQAVDRNQITVKRLEALINEHKTGNTNPGLRYGV
jgi:multidrug efflux pump subunit AcrA (membrane-fusion protein)